MRVQYIILFVLIFGTVEVFGRKLNRCQIVQELRKQNFPKKQLRNWVCLIEGESSGNTAAIGRGNSDGSTDYGLFQINDRFWCNHGSPGKGCNIECQQLLSDDISIASKCAKIIYRERGFNAWVAWKNKCEGKPLPKISKC